MTTEDDPRPHIPMDDPMMMFGSLTIWTQSLSAQVRGELGMALYISEDAVRSSENNHPVVITQDEARKLRDLLNMATARGQL